MCKTHEGKMVFPSQVIYFPIYIPKLKPHASLIIINLNPNNYFTNPRFNPKPP
ncbi:hypothetical protein HanRHA438_Chr11g0491421 [Helianthus annuus]|nr:hypothetical protein HanRHA438_Chr11g0491421 [Helianthus annuus]